MFYTGTRPVMVFTAGAPGAGKTYTLHRLFGLENVEMLDAVDMLDLDSAMKRHPEYSEERPRSSTVKSTPTTGRTSASRGVFKKC